MGLRRLVPAPLRALARALRERVRSRARRARLRSDAPVTRESLAGDLRAMGLRAGDLVLVHSSLSGLGWVEGGPGAVLGALDDVLGAEGTLLVPVYPLDRPARDWLATDPVCDPRTTPSRLGAISEAFRTRADVEHGDHPTHPVAGRGPLARAILAAHGTSPSPFGPDSAFERLARRGGRILALGSPFAHVSALHLFEEESPDFPVPVYLPGTTPARVRRADGTIETRPVRVMDPEVSRLRLEVRPAWARRIEEECVRRGAAARHPAGRGHAWVFDAARLQRVLRDLLDEGVTIYDREGGGAERQA